MPIFFAIQSTYETVQIAIFKQITIVDIAHIKKTNASKEIIPTLNALLTHNHLTLTDLSYIAVNQGPGPFTTLRAVITTVNGLSFARNIPLIGVNALDAFVEEQSNTTYPHTVVLLNAFNFDVYFAQQHNGNIKKGCSKIKPLLERIRHEVSDQLIRFIGNASAIYASEIQACFGDHAYLPQPLPETVSIGQIGLSSQKLWANNKKVSYQLLPIYLKQFAPVQQKQ